jgi:hypothetical protein
MIEKLQGLQAYNKAIAALVAGALIALLKQAELPVDQQLEDALGLVVLTFVVWLIPNKK